jgi:hypothetical protein
MDNEDKSGTLPCHPKMELISLGVRLLPEANISLSVLRMLPYIGGKMAKPMTTYCLRALLYLILLLLYLTLASHMRFVCAGIWIP